MLERGGLDGSREPSRTYPHFEYHEEERLRTDMNLGEDEENAFKADCRKLMLDTIDMADVVYGTPHGIATPRIYHFLHPSFGGVDEATMCKEADLPIPTHLTLHSGCTSSCGSTSMTAFSRMKPNIVRHAEREQGNSRVL
ncbi:hypothetical protein N7453_002567 [Penicillium expansum]|nr:hypothetical protein N7453_002567 [Penicillium expansum]